MKFRPPGLGQSCSISPCLSPPGYGEGDTTYPGKGSHTQKESRTERERDRYNGERERGAEINGEGDRERWGGRENIEMEIEGGRETWGGEGGERTWQEKKEGEIETEIETYKQRRAVKMANVNKQR